MVKSGKSVKWGDFKNKMSKYHLSQIETNLSQDETNLSQIETNLSQDEIYTI